jgi:phosphoenolpyruvate synthase/pyruvate phosphate dikinase
MSTSEPYVIYPEQISAQDIGSAGREGVTLSIVKRSGIAIPPTFILTAKAFDDFIVAADLIDGISESLHKVHPFQKKQAQQSFEEIFDLIMNASLPRELERKIIEGYRSLGGHEHSLVKVTQSNILEESYIPPHSNPDIGADIRGEESVIHAVKLAWCELFNAKALEHRINNSYSGALSQAVIVQKMIRPELTGSAFSIANVEDHHPEIEIHALYGLSHESHLDHSAIDIYQLDKRLLTITDKTIQPQNFMIIKRGKPVPGTSPNLRVPISATWSRIQKLDDSKIHEIAEITKTLEERLGFPLKIKWGIEAGEVFIFSIENLQEIPLNSTSLKLTMDNLPESDIEILAEDPEVEITIQEPEKPGVEIVIEEEVEAVPESQILENIRKEYNLITKLHLDLSGFSNTLLKAASSFDGFFVDGTQFLLTEKTLPEVEGSYEKVAKSIYNKICEIAEIDREKPFIYQLSNIKENEYYQLGISDNSKVSAARLIESPEALSAEVEAIKAARNKKALKKISISFPAGEMVKELLTIKKMVAGEGLRRNSSLKFYFEISNEKLISKLEKIPKNGFDGIIVDSRSIKSEKLINKVNSFCIANDWELYIRLSSEPDFESLKMLMIASGNKLILGSNPSEKFIEQIYEIEQAHKDLIKRKTKKVGRKIKPLD